jgi:hypothetical protein
MTITSESTATLTGPRSGADVEVWDEAYDEARRRGAGANVARFYAEQKVAYVRRNRDGIAVAGARDYQSYR